MKEIAIIGATACGKSDLALLIARRFNGVILSLDSLSVYKKINIVSAKPLPNELSEITHFGINLINPDEYFSVGEFIKEYFKAKNFATKMGKNLIITGGSSFYLKAMISGLAPKIKPFEISLKNDEIWNLAQKIDPNFCENFSKFDTFRLQKWYQIYIQTNQIPSVYLKQNTKEAVIKDIKIFEILCERKILREKIAQRTKKMLKMGLIDEAKLLFSEYGREAKALKCIGLKECALFLDGEISLSELENLITTHTAQLAKRQNTFNKSQFDDKISDSFDEISHNISDYFACI